LPGLFNLCYDWIAIVLSGAMAVRLMATGGQADAIGVVMKLIVGVTMTPAKSAMPLVQGIFHA
jgi:hypothetical protein